MLYVKSKILDDTEELIYKRYITDGLRDITESVSQAFGGNYLSVSFFDLIDNNKKQTATTRTGEEIAADVIKKAGLVVMSD